MPSITHYVLDRLLETSETRSPVHVQKVVPKPPPPPPDKATPVPVSTVRTRSSLASLYATPENTTLPDLPSSFPGTWSPYLINHKRRGASLARTFSQGDAGREGSQPNLPVMLPALPRGCEPTQVQEPEFVFQQAGNGQAEGESAVEEALNGKSVMLQKGKGSVIAEIEQEQPEFEFCQSLEALVKPVNVRRPLNGEAPEISESDTFEWRKPSSPLGTSVGTPGAEFYDAFEGKNQFVKLYLLSYFSFQVLMILNY